MTQYVKSYKTSLKMEPVQVYFLNRNLSSGNLLDFSGLFLVE